MGDENKTPEQLAEERRRDVMAYAYRETDGKLYTINESGDLIPAPADAKALSPEYQKIANQTAAIAITYRRILAMKPEDRGMLADLMEGKNKAGEGLNKEVSDIWNLLKKQTGFEVSIPGSGIVDAVSGVAAGAAVPFTFLSDAVRSGSQFFDALFGHDLGHKDAVAIGTAYASAAQAASESHKGFEFGSIFDYAAAAAKWVVTLVCDKLGLDKEHSLGWHKVDGSWESLLAAEHRSGDNERVTKEMMKLNKIGGVKTSELAVLTQGGMIEKKDGSETNVDVANSNNNAPKAGQNLTLEEAEAAAAGQKNPGIIDRLKKAAGYVGFDETKQKLNEAGVAGTVVGVTVGAGSTAYAAHRTAIGFSETFVGENSAISNAATKTGNEGLAARTGKEVKVGKHVIKVLSKEADAAKGEALLSKARDLATKAAEREVAHPGMVSLGSKARQFESWLDVVKHPIDFTLQKSGSMLAKMVDVHVQPTLFGSTKAAYLNPINYPKIMIRNGMNIVHGFNEGLEGIASTSGKAPVMERIGTSLGKGLAWAGSKIWTPAVAETLAAIPKGSLATATSASLGKVIPYVDAGLAGVESVSAIIEDNVNGNGDYSKSNTATAKFGIIGSCTAVGFGVGTAFPVVGNAVGAVGGALVGTGIWLFSGDAIGEFFGSGKKPADVAVAPVAAPDAGLTAAVVDQHSKTKAAQDSVKRQGLVFSGTVLNQVGAVGDSVTPLLSAGLSKPRDYNLVS